MTEKRQHRRIPVTLHLKISDLYSENKLPLGIHDLDSPIEIVDISTGGVAFISECVLPVGYFFDADLKLDNSTTDVFTVVKIVRSNAIDHTHYLYGCEFTTQPEDLMELVKKLEK